MRFNIVKALIVLLSCLLSFAFAGSVSYAEAGEKKLPLSGSAYTVDGQKTIVVGGGNKAFEYVSRGESLILIYMEDNAYKYVLVADEGVKVKVDPDKPSCLVGGREMLDSSIWKKGTYLLVEYDRSGNDPANH